MANKVLSFLIYVIPKRASNLALHIYDLRNYAEGNQIQSVRLISEEKLNRRQYGVNHQESLNDPLIVLYME